MEENNNINIQSRLLQGNNAEGRNPRENNRIQNERLNTNSYLSQILSSDKFLFIFEIEKLAYQFFCGCSLITWIRIIYFNSITSIFEIFSFFSIGGFISSVFNFTIFSAIAYNLIYSDINKTPKNAFMGYLLYSFLFLLTCFETLLLFLFFLFGIGNFANIEDKFTIGFIFLVIIFLYLSFHLYLVFICYSYWIHLKNGNIRLIQGDYVDENLIRSHPHRNENRIV